MDGIVHIPTRPVAIVPTVAVTIVEVWTILDNGVNKL